MVKIIQKDRTEVIMRDSAIVAGKIIHLQRSKAGEVIQVKFTFNKDTITSICLTAINDSLSLGDSVKLRISLNDPISYNQYIGLVSKRNIAPKY